MTSKRDYYDILDVNRDVNGSELKTAYRKLALKYHPDRNPGNKAAEENFKEAAEAYEVLSDPQKRNIYNQFGHAGLEGSNFSGSGGFDDIFSSFGDIFENFFGFSGGKRSRSRAQKGTDLRYDMTLSFMQAAFGTSSEIEIEKMEPCPECNGSMCEEGTHPERCSTCGGTGQVSRSQGFFMVRTACHACRGTGRIISHPCPKCRGIGRVHVKKMVSVKIPAGVDAGSRLRLTGEGEAGSLGGPSGDLYVFINVKPHDFFERDNTNVICQIPISFIQAALGDDIKIPTLEDEKTLVIPKGTQPGDIFRFHGVGIPSLRGNGRGDQIMQVLIKTPTNLNKKQEKLLKEFAKIESGKFSSKLKNILKSDFVKSSMHTNG